MKNKKKFLSVYLLVTISSWISRIATAFAQLLSMRVIISNLGSDQFAVFALLTGMLGWYALSDFGVGVSLQNYISEQRAREESYNEHIAIAGAIAICLLLITIICLYSMSPVLGTFLLKNFIFLSQSQKSKLFFVSGALLIISSSSSIICKIWYAEQKGVWANILPAGGTILGALGTWLVASSSVQNKLYYCIVAFFSPSAILMLLMFFRKVIPTFKSGHVLRKPIAMQILSRAFKFWGFGFLAACVLQADYLIMSQVLKPSDISRYAIITKIFGLIFFVYNALLAAIWPLCAEAIANNKWKEVLSLAKRNIFYGFIFVIVSTVFVSIKKEFLINILAPGEKNSISVLLVVLIGLYYLLRVWTDTYAMILQSASDLKPFWRYVPAQSILSIVLQWQLAKSYGLYGLILGLIGCYVLTVAWGLPKAVNDRAFGDSDMEAGRHK